MAGNKLYTLFYFLHKTLTKVTNLTIFFFYVEMFVCSGRSPSNLTLDYLRKKGVSLENGYLGIPLNSPDSVNVPGAAACWVDTVQKFGSGNVRKYLYQYFRSFE